MSREYTTVVGSGTVSQLAEHPDLTGLRQRYPVPSNRDQLRTRTGEGSVILNPEDFSVFLGLSVAAISISGVGVPLPDPPLRYRRALVLHNSGPDTLYIGPSGLNISNGFPINTNEKISIDITGNPNVYVYGISNGIANIRIMELA